MSLRRSGSAYHALSGAAEETLLQKALQVPNLSHPSVPDTEKVVKVVNESAIGVARSFAPRSHIDLMEAHDAVDLEAAAQAVGQKFYYLKRVCRDCPFCLRTQTDRCWCVLSQRRC